MRLTEKDLYRFCDSFVLANANCGINAELHITCSRLGYGAIALIKDGGETFSCVLPSRSVRCDKNNKPIKRTPSQLINDVLIWYCPANFGDYYDKGVKHCLNVSAAAIGVER